MVDRRRTSARAWSFLLHLEAAGGVEEKHQRVGRMRKSKREEGKRAGAQMINKHAKKCDFIKG
jgi:hypothetical protein